MVPPPLPNLEILLKWVSGAAINLRFSKFWAYTHMGCAFFNFIFVQFMQFPVLHFGLAHSGSRPFIYTEDWDSKELPSCAQLGKRILKLVVTQTTKCRNRRTVDSVTMGARYLYSQYAQCQTNNDALTVMLAKAYHHEYHNVY